MGIVGARYETDDCCWRQGLRPEQLDRIRMTPAELKSLRSRLGYTQQELAEAVGVSRRAIIYWELGERAIPKTAEKLIKLMIIAQNIQERSEPS